MSDKGLSSIIVSLIIILLALSAVAITSVAVNNIIRRGSTNIDITEKCLNVNVVATSVKCSPDKVNPESCTVQLQRTGQGDDEIGGVKIVFINSTGSRSSNVTDISGNIEVLGGKTQSITDGLLPNVNEVESIVYFLDDSGNPQVCTQPSSFEF